jgi:hypothetical protein
MFRGGQPYTDFRAINAKDGRIRLEGRPGGIKLEVQPTTISADRTIFICDCNGTMLVKGYHMIFGTALATGTMSLVPVGDFYKVTMAVTGVRTTSHVIAGINSTVTATGIAIGAARCTTADVVDLWVTNVTAATIANGDLQVSYMVLNPQST